MRRLAFWRAWDDCDWIMAGGMAFCFSLIAALVAIAVVGGSVDRGRCLGSHEAAWIEPITTVSGKGQVSVTYLPMSGPVCDAWEFPEGRPR